MKGVGPAVREVGWGGRSLREAPRTDFQSWTRAWP
jgi:hypothetical protein